MSKEENAGNSTKSNKKSGQLTSVDAAQRFLAPAGEVEKNLNATLRVDSTDQKKICALKSDILEAVHGVLKKNGVNAVIHTISFRSSSAEAASYGPIGMSNCYYLPDGTLHCDNEFSSD